MTFDEALEQLKTLAETAIASSGREGRRHTAGELNGTIRRLRSAENESDIAGLLVNSIGEGSGVCACLTFDGAEAHIGAVRGREASDTAFAISDSPALLSVIETKDTVVTAATARELSEPLLIAMGGDAEGKAYLVPVVVSGAVRMALVSLDQSATASLEALCAVAALRLEVEALSRVALARAESASSLVRISDAQIAGANASAPKWEDLSRDDQVMHLRAQRFAQVAVARMRVEHRAAVEDGQRKGDLYGVLQDEIDRARAEYRRRFFAGETRGMLDYLHLELVRSLANGEERLLGNGFPGRLT